MKRNPQEKFLIPYDTAKNAFTSLLVLALFMGLLSACSTIQKDWEKAQRTDTIRAYDEFLRIHSQGALADSARMRMRDLTAQQEWKTTQSLDTIEVYESFLRRHTQDPAKTQAAKTRITELRMRKAWEATMRLDTSVAYEEFLRTYPKGNLSDHARKRLKELEWLQAKGKNTIIAYEQFLTRHPTGDLAHQAKMRLRELHDWEQVRTTNNLATYEQFCRKHPQSAFLPEAEKQIEELANDDEINALRSRMESEKKRYGSSDTIGIFAYRLTRGESEIIYKGVERRYFRITKTDLKPRQYSLDVWKLKYTRPLEALILSINIADFCDAKTIINTMNKLHRGLESALGVAKLAMIFLDPGLEEYLDTQEYISGHDVFVYEGERRSIARDRTTYAIAQQVSRQELMKYAEDSDEETRIGAVRLLKAYHWAKNRALFRFSGTGELDKVKKALESGAEVNAMNKLGNTPLQEATKNGRSQVARLLIEYGARAQKSNENTLLRGKAIRLLSVKGAAAVRELILALNDDSEIVQKEAEDALVKIGTPAVMPLLNVFGAQGPSVQKRIMSALVRMTDSDFQPLLKRLDEGDGNFRGNVARALVSVLYERYNERAADILIRIGDPRVVDPLIRTLKDRTEEGKIRASVASVLRRVADIHVIEALVGALEDRYPQLRRNAAFALISIGSPAVEPLMGALHSTHSTEKIRVRSKSTEGEEIFLNRMLRGYSSRGYSSDDNPFIGKTVGEAACNLLIAIGAAATDSLLKGLRSGDDNTRRWSARALGRIREAHGLAFEPLLVTLRDSSADVRTEAAEALGIIGDSRSVAPLLDALLDESIEVRLTATVALGKPGNDKAVEPLIALMKGENKYLARSAESSLRSIGSSGISAMINLLQHPDEIVGLRALWAIEGASEMAQAYDALRFALSHKVFYSSFIENGKPSHVPLLIDALNTSGNKNMAEDFLNCGNNALEDAARDWAKRHGYQAWPRSSSSGGSVWKGRGN